MVWAIDEKVVGEAHQPEERILTEVVISLGVGISEVLGGVVPGRTEYIWLRERVVDYEEVVVVEVVPARDSLILGLGDYSDELEWVGDEWGVHEEEIGDVLCVEENVEELVLLDEEQPWRVEIFDELGWAFELLIEKLETFSIFSGNDGTKSDIILGNKILIFFDNLIVFISEPRVWGEVDLKLILESRLSTLESNIDIVDWVWVVLGEVVLNSIIGDPLES